MNIQATEDFIIECWPGGGEGDSPLLKLTSLSLLADGESPSGVIIIYPEDVEPLIEGLRRGVEVLARWENKQKEEGNQMDTIRVRVGSMVAVSGGMVQDDTQWVEFVGEEVASRTEYGQRRGVITDTRGTTETLYKAQDGRLIVHVEEWSRWQGEPTTFSMHQVTAEDLQPGGRWELLGKEAGMSRPLTLDEALAR